MSANIILTVFALLTFVWYMYHDHKASKAYRSMDYNKSNYEKLESIQILVLCAMLALGADTAVVRGELDLIKQELGIEVNEDNKETQE